MRPGGRLTFFASPKKVSKERRPGCGAPWVQGVPSGAHKLGGFHANSGLVTSPQTCVKVAAIPLRPQLAPLLSAAYGQHPTARLRHRLDGRACAARAAMPRRDDLTSGISLCVQQASRGQILRRAFGCLDIAGYKHMMRKQSSFRTTSARVSHAEFSGQRPELCSKTVQKSKLGLLIRTCPIAIYCQIAT